MSKVIRIRPNNAAHKQGTAKPGRNKDDRHDTTESVRPTNRTGFQRQGGKLPTDEGIPPEK